MSLLKIVDALRDDISEKERNDLYTCNV